MGDTGNDGTRVAVYLPAVNIETHIPFAMRRLVKPVTRLLATPRSTGYQERFGPLPG